MKYFRDTYAEHPDDRQNIEYSVFLDGDDALVTLSGMYEQMKQHGFNLTYARCVSLSSSSVTRFDEISPLWQNILRLWQKFYVIGLNFFVVNGQTLNSYLAIWSLCDFIEFILITSDLFWYPSTSFDILRPLLISSGLFWYPSTSFDIFWPLLISSGLFWYPLTSFEIRWPLPDFRLLTRKLRARPTLTPSSKSWNRKD